MIKNIINLCKTQRIHTTALIVKPPEFKLRIFSYDLNDTPNVYHLDTWNISKDFREICTSNNYANIVEFYNMFVKDYETYLLRCSNGTLEFYDTAWHRNYKVMFKEGIHKKFMNYNFREIMHANRYISKEVIQWFIPYIDIIHYYCVLNTLCNIGDLRTAKIMNEIYPFDFIYANSGSGSGRLHFDFFRSAAAGNHLEMAQWLYSLGAHKNYEFGYSNIKYIVNNSYYAQIEVKEWLNALPEFRNI